MAMARAWPPAPSSAARMTRTSQGRLSDGEHDLRRQPAEHDRQPERDVGAHDQADVAVVGEVAADARRQRDDAARVSSLDVAPLVAVQDRGDQQADRHRQDQRLERPGAADGVVGAVDHQRPHEQEDERHAERPDLYWNGGAV